MDEIIKLPNPQVGLSFPLMRALELRRTKRRWADTGVSEQNLSNLLWAACGITMAEGPGCKSRRTAPSATNCQEISLYVALESGLYYYDENDHRLIQRSTSDIRDSIGTQKMMRSAPVGIIYVADFSKMKSYLAKDDDRKTFVAGTDAGFISQNIYLYCAAAGLSTCILGLVDRDVLHGRMGLGAYEKVMYTQVVGNSL